MSGYVLQLSSPTSVKILELWSSLFQLMSIPTKSDNMQVLFLSLPINEMQFAPAAPYTSLITM